MDQFDDGRGKQHRPPLDRRTFLKSTGVAAAAASLTAAPPVQAEPGALRSAGWLRAGPAPAVAEFNVAPALVTGIKVLRLETAWPAGSPGLSDAAERLALRLEQVSGGRLRLNIVHAGAASDPSRLAGAVASGQADLYHGAEYYHHAKSPAFSFFAAVPGGMGADALTAWLDTGGGQPLWDDLAGQFGIKPFFAGHTGAGSGLWSKLAIDPERGFTGIALHAPGFAGGIARALGATPVTLGAGRLAPALADGTIAAAHGFGAHGDLGLGLAGAAAHFYSARGPKAHATALSIGVNRSTYDALGPAGQAMLEAVIAAEARVTSAEHFGHRQLALEVMLGRHAIAPQTLPDAITKRMAEASAAVLDEARGHDTSARLVHDSYMAFTALLDGTAQPLRPVTVS